MDFFTALLLSGIGIGLASVAGIRAFVPLTLVFLGIQLGLFVPPDPLETTGPGWVAVGVLASLAVVESVLDKIGSFERVFNFAMVPVRMVAGAVALPASMAFDLDALPWLVTGATLAGAVAVLKVLLRPRSASGGAGVSNVFLSFFEDVVAVVGGAIGLFVPYLPLAFVAFLLFFFHRVRRRRGRKYEGLRILRD